MKRHLYISFICLISYSSVQAAATAYSDSIYSHAEPPVAKSIESALYRTFNVGDIDYSSDAISDPITMHDQFLADSTVEQRNHAHALFEKVQAQQRFLESLDALSEVELPVGITKAGGAVDYAILIDRMTFTSRGAIMDVYVSLAIRQTGDRIAFHGKIPLSVDGGISGSARVYLVGDHLIQMSDKTLLTIKGADNTYVEFDCEGFTGISIEAAVEFSRDLIIPEDANGNPLPAPQRVQTSFVTYAQDLNDIMVGVSIPPFQIAGLNGVGFYVNQAFMDWSDLANPPGLSTAGHFPSGYNSPFLQAGQPNLWQGFFLQHLEVRLPPAFKKGRADNSRVGIGVERMIIDDNGFSGNIFAERVLDQGDMSGWSFSIDKVSLEIVTNKVRGFELAGGISMPMIKSKDGQPTNFQYRAQRSATGDYIFAVTIGNELKMDMWAANIKLFAGTTFIVVERNNKFYPSARLTGELTVDLLDKARFNSIRFEGMVISTEAPYFVPGMFAFGKEGESSKVSEYPLVISNIGSRSDGNRTGLAFDVTVNIGGKAEEGGFGGTASIIVWGKREQVSERDSEGQVTGTTESGWKFDKLEIGGVGIMIEKPNVFKLNGKVYVYDNDPVYGNGFKGEISGRFAMLKADVTVRAMFGKTPSFRYWYADALVNLDKGVPLAPGMSAYGFGGGYYSKMKQSGGSGNSPSGVRYVPDENTTGIKALMVIGTPEHPEPFNGMVTLDVVLNRHGGINAVTLEGSVRFMSGGVTSLINNVKSHAPEAVQGKALNKLAELLAGQVYGNARFHFDNVNDVFHGNLEVYVNVVGGVVRGVGSGNKAGWAVLHFAKNDWYILIGTPDEPIGLEVARIFQAKSYFMLGMNLPGSPPPPRQVTEILGNVDLDYMRDMNALKSGLGVAFGLHFSVDTGDLSFLMFYGRFAAGTGVDFMLKNYGEEYHCQGSSGSMGINGWYANGQAYAFVIGKIGIKVNLKFYKGNYDILDIGAAAVLQAKGPNPFWMRGIVGGYYNILGGLVKGRCQFEVTVGKECVPVGEQNLLEGVDIIAGMTPQNGSQDVDVFNAPQVAFNIAVGQTFEISDLDGKKHTFRARLDEFKVMKDKRDIIGTLKWNTDNTVAVFDGRDILPGESRLDAKVRLLFEEQINGAWVPVKFDGKIVEEKAEVTFWTSKEPDFIPPHNVSISYPVANQLNFYPQEYNKGFIQLKKGLPNLFRPGSEWIQRLRFTDIMSGQYFESEVSYEATEKRVHYNIPSGLQNERVYRFDVLNIPVQTARMDANVQQIETELNVGQIEGGADTLTTKRIEGEFTNLGIKSLYSSQFRSSRFNTFKAKMSAIALNKSFTIKIASHVYRLSAALIGDEAFDMAETEGAMEEKPLLSIEAVLSGNHWYERYVYPLVYKDYPMFGWATLKKRNQPEIFGIPPALDNHFMNTDYTAQLVSNESFLQGPGAFRNETLVYNVPESVNEDYHDLLSQVVNYVADNPSLNTPRTKGLLESYPPVIRYGPYRVKVRYTIPGINYQSSFYELELFNRIPD